MRLRGTSLRLLRSTALATIAAAPSAPVIVNQTLDYGAKYLTTSSTTKRYGAVVPTGSGWTSCVVNSGSTNATSHLEVNLTTGAINASPTGRDAGMPNTPYTLNITFTNAYGSTTVDIVVRFSGTDSNGVNLANAWSVASNTEAKTVVESASLTYGDAVLFRSGDYNQTQADNRWTRSATTAGTWNDYGVANDAWRDDNWIVLRPHYGAAPVIYYVSMRSDFGAGGPWRVRWKDMTFTDSEVYTTSVNGLLASYGTAGNYVSEVWIDGCTFNGGVGTNTDCIWLGPTNRASAAVGGKIRITDCTFNNGDNGFYGGGPDLYFVGNLIDGCKSDGGQLYPPLNRAIVRWNRVNGYTERFVELTILSTTNTNPFTATVSLADAALVDSSYNWVISIPTDSAVDGRFRQTSDGTTVNGGTGVITFTGLNGTSFASYTSGGKIYAYASHGDMFQPRNDVASAGDFDDIDFSYNILVLPPTTNVYTQGMAMWQGPASGAIYYNRVRARGNICISKQKNSLNFGQCNDADIAWNTVIDYPDYTSKIQPQLTPEITCTTGTGNVLKYNICHTLVASGATLTGNEQLTRGDSAAYTAAFTNPVGLLAASIDPPVDYGLKVGGTWSANATLPGATPYVDFTNRTTNFPDETGIGQTFVGGFDGTFVGGFNG
jgi:hypothetical protein